MADDAKELFNHVAFLVIIWNKHASLEQGFGSLLTLLPHLSVLPTLPRPARRPAPDPSFPLTVCCSSLSLPILFFQPLGVIRPLSCCPSVSLARETFLGLAELGTSYFYVSAQGSCSGVVTSATCLWNREKRKRQPSFFMAAQSLWLSHIQGVGRNGSVQLVWGMPKKMMEAGNWVGDGPVLGESKATSNLSPWLFLSIWTPLFLFGSQSPASWPSGGRRMLSLCYCGGLGRKATVSLVFNLGTESGRETYLLVATIHQNMTCFWLKAMRNIEQ